MKLIYLCLKRLLDIVVAGTALLLLSPLLVWLGIRIRKELGSPILFRQQRPGKHNRLFTLYKFRSMIDSNSADGVLQPDSMRLTTFGLKLRSSSLDELPTLFNVLKGDMTLVGPRPLLPEYVPLYSKEQARRHEVKSGVTGWAQINGRNAISWEEKFRLDVWYVDNQSLWLDLKIIVLTLAKVIKREDIQQQGEVTMSRFTGER